MGRVHKPRWQSKARSAAHDYPMLQRALDDLRQPRITASMDTRSSSGRSRITEDVALRELPPEQMRRLRAVESALKATADMANAEHRLRLIRMVYLAPYNQRRTIEGAAMEIPMSARQAYEWTKDFLLLVYGCLEYGGG